MKLKFQEQLKQQSHLEWEKVNVAKSYIELAKEVLSDERINNKTKDSNELQSR